MADTRDPIAPHGYDEDGQPLAPYGLKIDGTPRLSKRGAQAGQKGNGNRGGRGKSTVKTKSSNNTDQKRKEMLVGLADMLIATPLAGASTSGLLKKRIGAAQTDALAGDAVIVSHFAPSFADGLITLGESKPAAIAWLDSVEEKAPYIMLAQVGVQMMKAFIGNHLNPDPRLAEAGRTMVAMKAAQMAEEIEREAEELGIPTSVPSDLAEAA